MTYSRDSLSRFKIVTERDEIIRYASDGYDLWVWSDHGSLIFELYDDKEIFIGIQTKDAMSMLHRTFYRDGGTALLGEEMIKYLKTNQWLFDL